MSPHDDVPNELWMDIFESMDVPQDLHAVILTCKKFYMCGVRALLRNLVWSTPKDVAANLPAWRRNSYGQDTAGHTVASDVRSLSLGVSWVPESFPVMFVDERGHERPGPLPQNRFPINEDEDVPENINHPEPVMANTILTRSIRYYQIADRQKFASSTLYEQMCSRIISFSNLEKLECKDMVFTDQLFSVIHSLPALRKLSIELCLFPSRQTMSNWDHSQLPITDLKLLNLRRRVTNAHEFAGNNGKFWGFRLHTHN